ncbi:Cysteine-rich protein 2-binding protein [Cryptotermes secundus]|uniref:Cysteine-rich protein 2-binding protein n=1 Tax=Cryptotermes secundus TaxID=105785 RepID=A0A2J7R3L5_9NEOP|nr:cysteine-rich protein 2-binding protein [Cryptotermes secundus]PNF35440.1 Cysteine-rich protein 2-binding protein [Cryptotermes secundus]PNF35441.1 Cysteine-rich protein 2-binding protein [Cryptotermes secundus]
MSTCAYCLRTDSESYLTCEVCSHKVHIRCLKSGGVPGGLRADVFYKFVCHNCSTFDQEEFTRIKMPWVNLIILTLYNLQSRSDGVSWLGYFHWKMHISNFIERQWNVLFGSSVKKKRSWKGTVSGTLSHYSPTYFLSGSAELGESGWWKLAANLEPELLMQRHVQLSVEKRWKRKNFSVSSPLKGRDSTHAVLEPAPGTSSQELSPYTAHVSHIVTPDESSLSANDDTSSVELNNAGSERDTSASCSSGRMSAVDTSYNNWAFLKATDNMYSRAYVEPSETLSDCLFADENEECSDAEVDVEATDICPSSQSFGDLADLLPQQENTGSSAKMKMEPTELVCVKQEIKEEVVDNEVELGVGEYISDEGAQPQNTPRLSPSLFTITKSRDHMLTASDIYEDTDTRCLPMSEYEELQLLNQLRRVPSMGDVPGAVRRLYRKLCVRRLKRERGMPLFNLDDIQPGRRAREVAQPARHVADVRILDRFQHAAVSEREEEASSGSRSFILRLMGQSEPFCFCSPYTRRLLKPYIRRDMETTPLWLQLMSEVQAKANRNVPHWQPPPRHPIDYSYVRPQHVSSVNSLCQEFFYPGIDLTECLQYPDFSCVVLYKKLVVGFAFMVPDVGLNEAYISFLFTRPEWRRAGIGTFMLYHLIQTCMGKDVTLHVSATNPAIILYQKFGFKVEEFVQDFYDKYLPADSKECKHALFLRLSR